jgi:aminomethyltransferase
LRLEAGNCLYGHELSDTTSPLQAGLGWVTKLRKPGGFLGSAAIADRRQTDSSVLVSLVLKKRIAREGMTIRYQGVDVGSVTSGTMAPTLGHGVALAYVGKAFAEPGTVLEVDVRGRTAQANVVKGPFYKRGD